MAKLKVGDVVEFSAGRATKIGVISVVGKSGDVDVLMGGGWTMYGLTTDELTPRPDLLPYGKPDAKWWEARLWRVACEERFGRKKYKGWYEVCLPNKRARPIEIPHGAPVPLPAAIRALRKLAIEYGMNIKIMEDER